MQKKMLALMMALVLSLSLIGCGGSSQPVNGEVADSIESTESNTETVTSEEAATKTEEITDGKVASSDKPAEPSATSTAEPTASPTEKPQATATPEPTAPPHVHEYAEAITKQPTCAVAGEKKLTCSCGDTKTEEIPATGNHNWVTQYTQVEHEALGHVETTEQQVQVGTTRRSEYECAYCGARFDSPDAKDEHQAASGTIEHAGARTIVWDYDEPVYESQTASEWVIDSPAWTENVPCGEICSTCGATK